jgi:IclR family KDG regulon transcriptional repressor
MIDVPESKDPSSIYQSQILDRTFQLLGVLADCRAGLRASELTTKLDLHKSTTHRLIMILKSNRFIERDPETRKYRLGPRVMELGLSAVSRFDIYEIARPHMCELVEETGETAHLGVLRESEVVSVIDVESTRTLRATSEAGTRQSVHCSSLGKAILAFSGRDAVDAFLKERKLEGFTHNTITSPDLFMKELDSVRQKGPYGIVAGKW